MSIIQKKQVPLLATVVALFFLADGLCHALLQNGYVYNAVGEVVKTYAVEQNDDGSWYAYHVREPFAKITNDDLVVFDAAHYNSIKEYLYQSPFDIDHREYAFFPLFPLLWRATGLSPIGICLLNIMLFLVGVVVLLLLFKDKMTPWVALLTVCMPYLVVFAIPYSEALFFIVAAAGLYGLVNRRYWLYFTGFLLVSMTRSASNILLVAWLITDLLICLQQRESWKTYIKNVALHLAPVIAGVAFVIIFQRLCGATQWFQFVSSQEIWGKEISLPQWPFTDWSVEGKSVTWALIFTLFIPALAWLATKLFASLGNDKTNNVADKNRQWQIVRLLSVLFFVGNIVLALFTQKGCMYSQARLLTCTPFFVFLVLDIASKPVPKVWRWLVAVCLVAAAILCSEMLFGADTLGCLITLLLITLVFFHHWMPCWLRSTLFGITVALNIYWTAYLFNCFLNGGWCFT